jgi:hypothetical protein
VDCTNPCIASLIFLALGLVIGPSETCKGSLRVGPPWFPSTTRYTSVSSTTWKSKWDRIDPAEAKRKTEPPNSKDEGSSSIPKVESQPSRNRDIKCFKCLGSGHIASQCPNRRVMIMRDNEEVMTENKADSDGVPELVDDSDDDGVVYAMTGESLVARRALNTHIKVDDAKQQRDNIFHTRCHVNSKVCSMIIDGGSCTNVASTTLVEKLNLPTLKHSRPYKLQGLNDCGEVRVDRQVLVTFSIGKYQRMRYFVMLCLCMLAIFCWGGHGSMIGG